MCFKSTPWHCLKDMSVDHFLLDIAHFKTIHSFLKKMCDSFLPADDQMMHVQRVLRPVIQIGDTFGGPTLITLFLSPPVLMHGGLLCIAFSLSACLSGCVHHLVVHHLVGTGLCCAPPTCVVHLALLVCSFLACDLQVKGHMGQGQIRVPYQGRWAYDNIKLLHL